MEGVDLVSGGDVHVDLGPLLLEQREHLDVREIGHRDPQLGAIGLQRHHAELALEIEGHQIEHGLGKVGQLDVGELVLLREALGEL